MNEHNRYQEDEDTAMYPLPKGVIQAGIAGAEAAANDGVNKQSDESTVNVDAVVPVFAEKNRLQKFINIAKHLGRTALEQLPSVASVSWQAEDEERR